MNFLSKLAVLLVFFLLATSCAMSYHTRVSLIKQKSYMFCQKEEGVRIIYIYDDAFSFKTVCNNDSMFEEKFLNLYERRRDAY
jgi:hypothetical protein